MTNPTPPVAPAPIVLSPKERARNAARKEAANRTGALAEFLEAMADELDRQIAYDAQRAAVTISNPVASNPAPVTPRGNVAP